VNYLPRLALNCDPPHLYLLSSKDYRHEPLALSYNNHFFLNEGMVEGDTGISAERNGGVTMM
jgi:hypothetical protein